MSTHLKAFTLFAILIASIGGGSAFAQTPDLFGPGEKIVVTTDKESYGSGDKIQVTGEVQDLLSGFQISLQVFEPRFGNMVYLDQFPVGPDKKFSVEITAGGNLFKSEGSYTIVVQYGGPSRTAETTFQFGGPGGGTTPGPSGPRIEIGDTGKFIGYSITGGSVISIVEDFKSHSLIITISTTSDGELTITLPRSVIDAKMDDTDTDDEYIVLVDFEEIPDYTESKTPTDRTLIIPFEDGTEVIEIIGTFVIPEFGTIAVLILAIAIISIIAVSSKTKLSILPKY